MIRQDADRDRLKRATLLNRSIGISKPIDVPDQEVG
jgi:hypothetical protein